MGNYFPLSNNQRDAATMLYLKDPTSTSHSSTPIGNTIMYMNFPSSSEAYSNAIAGNSHSHTACMDVPPVTSASNSSSQEFLMNFGGSRALENQLNTWKDRRNEMLMMHQGENSCVLQGTPNLQGQGLSLSLSTHVPLHVSSIPYNESGDYSSILGSNPLLHGEDRGRNISFENEDNFQNGVNADGASDISSYGMQSISRTVPNSKYLRAAQELLDEVVNVKKAIKEQHARKELRKDWKEGEFKDGSSDPSAAASSSATPNANGPSQIEFSPSEKQELQNKLTKLLSMLDEVDRKYRQYYHQMQIVVSSFDVIAGSGAAKPYTALALQTISRHFRCLRDAINAQIQVARSSLGEEDGAANDRGVGISRLRYVDQQLRQQRALQQLGMMQQHAWRPQRGLPETSVSVLRAWLFEHFLHPYPKDSEKIMLARQAGLTRSQVSNWFINARVRLWKPMVEEMYKEETGDADMDSNTSSETNQRSVKPSQDKAEEHAMEPKSDEINDVEMMGSDVNSIFQSEYGVGEAREGRMILPESSRFQDQMVDTSYHIAELERFGSVGGVSLTLGLQSEGGRMGMHDGSHNPFMPLRESDLYNSTSSAMGSENAGFECMDSGNRQHQLVSSLLPSFT